MRRIEELERVNRSQTTFLKLIEGDFLLLECETPEFISRTAWYQNRECINPNRKHVDTRGRVTIDERRRYIKFQRLRIEDTSLYTCTNRSGEVIFMSYDLNVREGTMLDFESPLTWMRWATIIAVIIFLIYFNFKTDDVRPE